MNEIFNGLQQQLQDILAKKNIVVETEEPIASYQHQNEDTADNRMFIWDFSSDDLKSFVAVFEAYKKRPDTENSRTVLDTAIRNRCSKMIGARCLPIECMLYASKVCNSRLNDAVNNLIAVQIRQIYQHHGDKTAEVLEHIISNWVWVPQVRIAIVAVGLIRERDELFDCIMPLATGDILKKTVFYALMQKKSKANLERAAIIVSSLKANQDVDREISELFQNECTGFMALGNDYLRQFLKEYLNDSAAYLSNIGRSTFKAVTRIWGLSGDDKDIDKLARLSRDDDQAYIDFLDICRQRNDEAVTFRCRFSRREIVTDFLEPLIRSNNASALTKNNALISVALLSCSRRPNFARLSDVKAMLRQYQQIPEHEFACLAARMVTGDPDAIKEFVTLLRQRTARDLYELYTMLNTATITKSRSVMPLVRSAIRQEFNLIVQDGLSGDMYCFASNLKVFKERNVVELMSDDCLKDIRQVLLRYARDTSILDADAVINLIDVTVIFSIEGLTDVLFKLYDQHSNLSVRSHADSKLANIKGRREPEVN